jgi:pyruvate-formate lyase-activating enzyme
MGGSVEQEGRLGEKGYSSPTYYELKAPKELDWRPFRPESYFQYRREWDRRGLEGRSEDFPLHLDIDPTNRCNLSCPMCPRTHYIREGRREWAPKGPRDMDMALYRLLIEEGRAKGLRSVKLNFLGEPLLYPHITDMVAIASQAGLWVMMNTNAVALGPDLSRKLLESGLTDIFFSFDSPYPEEYERIRLGASYSRTLENIRSFMAIKEELGCSGVQTRASLVLPEAEEGREDLKRDYIKLFRDLKVAEIGFGLPTVMGRDYAPLNPEGAFACPDLFRRLFVFSDGQCGPCCGDWERRLIVGQAGSSPISAIWGGEACRELRKAHLSGAYRDIPACRGCSVPYLSTVEL